MKNMNMKATLTVLSIALCFSLSAQGPPGGGQGRGGKQGQNQQRSKPDASEILSMLDTNNDEVIDKDEASKDKRGKIAEDFDEIDADEDGYIDLEELKASLNNRKPKKKISAEKIIKEVDDNGDGLLNELEIAAKDKRNLVENFSKIDTNQDNEISLEELKAFLPKNDKEKKKKKRE